ncbi:MAG: hypothetical protein L3J70_12510 [Gammaproteobacteria bacterium]|nr:hypothetical protein [Gammaproteobacteria bacterium]
MGKYVVVPVGNLCISSLKMAPCFNSEPDALSVIGRILRLPITRISAVPLTSHRHAEPVPTSRKSLKSLDSGSSPE